MIRRPLVIALLALVPQFAGAQSDRLDRALASIPDEAFATQAWHPDQSRQGFVYVLAVTGRPRGTVFQPSVRDLGVLQRPDLVRALRSDVPDEEAASNVVVDPVRNAAGDVVAYVVRHRAVQVSSTFARDGRYTLYVRLAGEPMEMGGGGGGGGGGM
jgi:hypothetical protein